MLLYAVTALQDYMHYSVGKYDERLLLNLTKTLYFCAHRFIFIFFIILQHVTIRIRFVYKANYCWQPGTVFNIHVLNILICGAYADNHLCFLCFTSL